jgi:hypothetical protein
MYVSYSPSDAFLSNDTRNAAESTCNLGRNGSLTTDLDRLKWAQRNIGDELRRGTGRQVDGSLETVRILLADEVAVKDLEELVSSILETSLGLFANQLVCDS